MKIIKYVVLTLCVSFFSIIGSNAFSKELVQKESLIPTFFDIANSVLKMPLDKGISASDAKASINSKAAELNMKSVGYLAVSSELRARGLKANHLEIFQFCNPEDAMKMVEFNTVYAAFMPCSIALVEDSKGRLWLQMLNLDMIISEYNLPEDLRKIAISINAQMLAIITAGVKGSF